MATNEVLTRISDYSEAQNGGENYVMNNSVICTHRQILLGAGAHGGTVGRGSALQAGSSQFRLPMVSLVFIIELILPTALWLWGRLIRQQ
jgi:hypothetical protein